MKKLISFMHISLDGFVAGPNGELNWVTINEELFNHVGKRIQKSDTAMYGRVTYEMMESYWPTAGTKPGATKHDIEHSKWYAEVRKIVLSKTMLGEGLNNTIIIKDDISSQVNAIKNSSGGNDKDILVFGSPRATHTLMQLGLIDGYWLFVNPVILGSGIPLFTGVQEKTKLKLLNTTQFSFGVTELNYVVEKV